MGDRDIRQTFEAYALFRFLDQDRRQYVSYYDLYARTQELGYTDEEHDELVALAGVHQDSDLDFETCTAALYGPWADKLLAPLRTMACTMQRQNAALAELETSIQSLDKASLRELRALQRPGIILQNLMSAICVLMSPSNCSVLDADWKMVRKLISDVDYFLNRASRLHVATVPEHKIGAVQPFLAHKSFTTKAMTSVSKHALVLSNWVYALVMYHEIWMIRLHIRQEESNSEDTVARRAEAEVVRKEIVRSTKHLYDEMSCLQSNVTQFNKEVAPDLQLLHERAVESDKGVKETELAMIKQELKWVRKAIDDSLSAITSKDLQSLAELDVVPVIVELTLAAARILVSPEGYHPTDLSWASSRELLFTRKSFLRSMRETDQDRIAESTTEALHVYINNPDFVPNTVMIHSKTAALICGWVRSMLVYSNMLKTCRASKANLVQPILTSLAELKLAHSEADVKVPRGSSKNIAEAFFSHTLPEEALRALFEHYVTTGDGGVAVSDLPIVYKEILAVSEQQGETAAALPPSPSRPSPTITKVDKWVASLVTACKHHLSLDPEGYVHWPEFSRFENDRREREVLLITAAEDVEDALANIKIQDIQHMRSLLRPPAGCKLVMDAIRILLSPEGFVPTALDWLSSRAMLNDGVKFLARLSEFNRNSIPSANIRALQTFMENPAFVPSAMIRTSHAAKVLCKWVRGVFNFYVTSRWAKGEAVISVPVLEDQPVSAESIQVALRQCGEEIDSLCPSYAQIEELRDWEQPPDIIVLVMSAVQILLSPWNCFPTDISWRGSRQVLSDPLEFRQDIHRLDKDKVPDINIARLQSYLANPNFNAEHIAEASPAANVLCQWVRAVVTYHGLLKQLKRVQHSMADAELATLAGGSASEDCNTPLVVMDRDGPFGVVGGGAAGGGGGGCGDGADALSVASSSAFASQETSDESSDDAHPERQSPVRLIKQLRSKRNDAAKAGGAPKQRSRPPLRQPRRSSLTFVPDGPSSAPQRVSNYSKQSAAPSSRAGPPAPSARSNSSSVPPPSASKAVTPKAVATPDGSAMRAAAGVMPGPNGLYGPPSRATPPARVPTREKGEKLGRQNS